MLLYAGLHFLAWGSTFPSTAESIIWKTSAIVTLWISAVLVGVASYSKHEVGRLVMEFKERDQDAHWYLRPIRSLMNNVLPRLIYPSMVIYGIARLSLMAVAFSSLRAMPVDVYETTWSKYLPSVH